MDNQQDKFLLYFTSTHWDREWYLTFQGFRARLTDRFGQVLDVLESDSSYEAFICDGQTVILEDYLSCAPYDEKRVRDLLSSGRLIAGPWYTMPDENLVSGESLIQNLRLGFSVARAFGADNPLPLGYMCDIFGHIAQMPQILNGFGIKSAFLGRGTNKHETPAFFNWESPSGHSCVTYKVPESCGYGSFWFDVFFKAGENPTFETLFELACSHVEQEMNRTELPFVLLTDGMDHAPIHPIAPKLASALAEKYGAKLMFGKPEPFFDELLKYKDKMPVRTGELQKPAKTMDEHNKLISNTLSSRYDLKLANDEVQSLLEKEALPLAALAVAAGRPVKQTFDEISYKYLIKNHAHDSICGCSIDDVHADMIYRFRQARQTALQLRDFALFNTMGFSSTEGKPLYLTVINTHPFPQNREVVAHVDFPCDYKSRFDEFIPSEPINQFVIKGSDGKIVPYTIIDIKKDTNVHAPMEFTGRKADRYTVCFTAALPPMQSVSYEIYPSETPVRYFSSLKTGLLSAENEHLALHISPLGIVNLTDKKSGMKYENLISYSDSSETGDGWYSRQCVPDRIIHSAAAVSVETVLDGDGICTFCITHIMRVPENVEYNRQYTRRNNNCSELYINTYVTMLKSADYIKIKTEVQNNCLDHRLKAVINTGITSDFYHAQQAFAFIKRPVGRDAQTENWKEPDKSEKSFGNILYRRNESENGLAVISAGGLHEAAAEYDGRFELTLMRCFSKTFLTDGEKDGQLSGTQSFSYLIKPMTKATTEASLLRICDALSAAPMTYTVWSDTVPAAFEAGYSLNSESSHISIIRPSSDKTRVLMRVTNYRDMPINECIVCRKQAIKAYQCDFTESVQKELTVKDGNVHVALNPHEIVTILIEQ